MRWTLKPKPEEEKINELATALQVSKTIATFAERKFNLRGTTSGRIPPHGINLIMK